MSITKLLMFSYFAGAALFVLSLIIIGLRALNQAEINPVVPLLGGFVLMFGSKIALLARRKAR